MASRMKVVIVGGLAGGATTAVRVRRRDESGDIVLFEPGEQVPFANCGLPYPVGGVIADREKLLLLSPSAPAAAGRRSWVTRAGRDRWVRRGDVSGGYGIAQTIRDDLFIGAGT